MFTWSIEDKNIFILHFEGALSLRDQAEYLAVLDTLSLQKAPFSVLVTSNGDSPLSPDNKKKMNLWFKEAKDRLAQNCRMLVRVQKDFAPDHYVGSNMEKALPFPIRAATTFEDGLKIIQATTTKDKQQMNT